MDQMRLPNGIELIVAPLPHARSVSVVACTPCGGAADPPSRPGLTHLLEHLICRGGQRYGLEAPLASELERQGIDFYAVTKYDFMCIGLRAEPADCAMLINVLADLFQTPRMSEAELDLERKILGDEVTWIMDDPESHCQWTARTALWGPEHPLGRSLAGDPELFRTATVSELRAHAARVLHPESLVLVVTGPVSSENVLDVVAEQFGHWRANGGAGLPQSGPLAPVPFVHRVLPVQNAYVRLGFRAGNWHGSRFMLDCWNQLIAACDLGYISQLLREQAGLCYDVRSKPAYFRSGNEFWIWFETHPTNVAEATELLLSHLAAWRPTETDLRHAIRRTQTRLRFDLESSYELAYWIGRNRVLLPAPPDLDQVLAELGSVTLDQLDAVRSGVLSEPPVFCVVGPAEMAPELERTRRILPGGPIR